MSLKEYLFERLKTVYTLFWSEKRYCLTLQQYLSLYFEELARIAASVQTEEEEEKKPTNLFSKRVVIFTVLS